MDILTGKDFKGMIASASANLENSEKEINALNVFPVPDGDTGTNMSMTFTNGSKEANGVISDRIDDVSKALSKGLLMGTRGNSGVIASQIFRGFAKYAEGKEFLTSKDVADAFLEGTKVAYKAIMKPVEGTILTVIRESSLEAHKDFENNPNIEIEEYFNNLLKHANISLNKTPELLKALKEAGVVDSGGAGLVKIFEGFCSYLNGEPITKKDINIVELNNSALNEMSYKGYYVVLSLNLNPEYQKKFDLSLIEKRLSSICEGIEFNNKNSIVDIKLFTLKPGEVLNICQRYGEFSSLNIENKMDNVYSQAVEEKEYGIIAVAYGKGLTNIFYDLKADQVIMGGQTMNPSCQDFLDTIDKLDNCKTIFIFPNNSNIILTAKQAKDLSKKDVVVIESKSIQSGLSALAQFDFNSDKDNNIKIMNEVINDVKTAQITYAVKDTSFEGIDVKEGDYISLMDKTIVASGDNLEDICYKTIDQLKEGNNLELLTVIGGEDANNSLTDSITSYAKEKYNLDVDVIDGGQPVYSYLFALE